MYEHRSEPLLNWREFLRRTGWHALAVVALLGASLAGGAAGFHWFAGQDWIDGLLNAAMFLGGMGPVGNFAGTAGKLFASFFALYAGLLFIIAASVLLAPWLHRMLHRLHVGR
jgi:hypothetical protein